MLAKVSTFIGPNSFFSTITGTPSLVLSLDATGYTSSGVWFDLTTLNNDGISDGSVSWSSESSGSFDFDGSSAYFLFGKSIYTFNPSTSSTYGVTVSSNSVTSLEPTGNWDTKQAVSLESHSGGVRLKFQTSGVNPFLMCGLSDNPDGVIVNYSKPNYGFYVQGTNLLTIVEGNNFNVNPMSGTYSGTTNYIIIWDGSDVKYYVDEVLVYTSATTPANPLYLYCTFLNSGFTINNIEFGPYVQGIPIGNSPYVQGIPIGNSPYTMEAWFKSDSFAPSEQGTLIGWGDSGLMYKSNVLRLNANGFTNYWWGDDISVSLSGTSSMDVNNWYYVVATYDGTTRKLYLNGNLIQSSVPGAPLEVDNIQTLKVGYSYTNYFNGKISKVKVHSKALSGSKILSNFNSDKVRHGYVLGSMVFNSTSSSYLISSSIDYAFGLNDFTIEAFIYPQLSTFDYGGIVSTRELGNIDVAINTVLNNTSTPLIEFDAAGTYLTFTISNDNWYHAAISRVGGTTSFYVNGTLFTSILDTTNYVKNNLAVGRYYTDYDSYYFNGLISNVRVINGTGLYSGSNITIPTTPLTLTADTKLLITSQQTSPSADVSGNLQSITSSNIGWTSSLPFFEIIEFDYPDFSSTAGLELISILGIYSGVIFLTNIVNSDVGNIYRTNATNFNRSFNLTWNLECGGGSGADGFCIQWTTQNNLVGGAGGDVGADYSAINLFQFRTYSNNSVSWRNNLGTNISQSANPFLLRQNVWYWLDYDYLTSTVTVYYATTNVKPLSPQHTFTGVVFDSNNYYFGIGAACGGSNDFHKLKSMKLSFPL